MNKNGIRIESKDDELRVVIERWLTDAGYSLVKKGAALTIVDDETCDEPDKINDKMCLHIVYKGKKYTHEIERPFTRGDFMTAVGSCVRANGNIAGELVLNPKRMAVLFRGAETLLTEKEYAVLELLCERGEEGVTYDELGAITCSDPGKKTNASQVYICFLRTKLETLTGTRLIRTIRGRGYVLAGD